MTLSQRSYLNPETKMIRDQQFDHSLGCTDCVHHAYVGRNGIRVCNRHDLVGTNMSPCSDFREKSSRERLNRLFKNTDDASDD